MLDLNYTPEQVVDISDLTQEEWFHRRLGIGGSDVAAIMGTPFANKPRTRNNDKILCRA